MLCADGSPVPGATVCAYDVDWWWWWFAEDQVGCATTDATGSFEFSFRWCCGWYPWWWWRLRRWQLEPGLAERILSVVNKDPRLPKLPVPTPKPDIAIFNRLLLSPIGRPVVTGPGPIEPPRPQAAGLPHGFARAIASDVDPAKLGGLRETLLKQIPSAPELEKLRIWPWYEWAPWWDCEPDIIFRVTQNCAGVEQVIVQESFLNARFDVPTSLDVTLVANSSACCAVGQKPPPPGNCVLLSSVCSDENLADQITNIGGNIGAPATPVGYQNPGLVAPTGDRPYAGTLSIFGQFGAGATADYYEFEYSDNNGASWTSLPPGSVAAPPRLYFGPPLFGEPAFPPIRAVPSTITTIGARTFIKSRAHFEANRWRRHLGLYASVDH